MPIRRAASAFCTTASIALPSRVRRENRCSPAASASPTAGIAICSGDTATPPIMNGSVAQGMAKPRGSLPKVNSTVLSARMPSATVAISQAFEPRRANGRTATSSTTTPYSAHSASARSTAGTSGQPSVTANV